MGGLITLFVERVPEKNALLNLRFPTYFGGVGVIAGNKFPAWGGVTGSGAAVSTGATVAAAVVKIGAAVATTPLTVVIIGFTGVRTGATVATTLPALVTIGATGVSTGATGARGALVGVGGAGFGGTVGCGAGIEFVDVSRVGCGWSTGTLEVSDGTLVGCGRVGPGLEGTEPASLRPTSLAMSEKVSPRVPRSSGPIGINFCCIYA